MYFSINDRVRVKSSLICKYPNDRGHVISVEDTPSLLGVKFMQIRFDSEKIDQRAAWYPCNAFVWDQ